MKKFLLCLLLLVNINLNAWFILVDGEFRHTGVLIEISDSGSDKIEKFIVKDRMLTSMDYIRINNSYWQLSNSLYDVLYITPDATIILDSEYTVQHLEIFSLQDIYKILEINTLGRIITQKLRV